MSTEHLAHPEHVGVPRPASLDALLDHVAAGLVVEEPYGPVPSDERHGPAPAGWRDLIPLTVPKCPDGCRCTTTEESTK